jgi:hypothetical protein
MVARQASKEPTGWWVNTALKMRRWAGACMPRKGISDFM